MKGIWGRTLKNRFRALSEVIGVEVPELLIAMLVVLKEVVEHNLRGVKDTGELFEKKSSEEFFVTGLSIFNSPKNDLHERLKLVTSHAMH